MAQAQPQAEWYVVKQANGQCAIVQGDEAPKSEHWGPVASEADAIARRIGLIRSGKCKPA
ncbi:MAG: hypothetical protein AAF289_18220 [Cyanobacteria bacterium P01_A01_bin.135]